MGYINAQRFGKGFIINLLALLIDNSLIKRSQILITINIDITIEMNNRLGRWNVQLVLPLQLLDNGLQILKLGFTHKPIEKDDHTLDLRQLRRIEMILTDGEPRDGVAIDELMPLTIMVLRKHIFAICISNILQIAPQSGTRRIASFKELIESVNLALISKAFVENL
jgi:hypothetical protein